MVYLEYLSPSYVTVKYVYSPAGLCKLNVSACIKDDQGPAGFGGLLRNDKGIWEYVYMGNIGRNTIIQAHLWSIREGLKIARDKAKTGIQVEVHNSEVYWLLEGWSKSKEYKVLVEYSREKLKLVEGSFQGTMGRNDAADFLSSEGVAYNVELVVLEKCQKAWVQYYWKVIASILPDRCQIPTSVELRTGSMPQ